LDIDRLFGVGFELFAHVHDVNVDGAFQAIVAMAEGGFEEFEAGESAARLLDKGFEEGEFFWSEVNEPVFDVDFVTCEVDGKIFEVEFFLGLGQIFAGAAEDCPDPGNDFTRAKRLGDVIICAQIKPEEDIIFC
jgi:hypothetical protein